ncbi:MAG: Trk system potassium transporter TrkA [Planctomycetota bacterium]|jgi:trk system potassium uptake protein TrkA
MNIVIIGAGEVGQHLAGVLSREEHSVTVVDPDPSKSRKLTESLDVQALVGDGTRADTLTDAGASSADLVVAVSDDDRVNMLTSVVAKKLGASRVIIRLKDTRVLDDYRYFYKDALGFDVVLSTEQLVAEELLNLVRARHALEVTYFANDRLQLRRLRLKEDSALLGKPLEELRIPTGVLVAAISRGGELVVPSGADALQGKDQVHVLGSSEGLDEFERLAGEKVEWRSSVVIMGAGGIGREIALRLSGSPGISVLVLEQDPARARALDLECSGDLTVMVGDATDLTLFREERLADASVFVATTHDDEDNIVACQLAKSFGVKRTVALVEKASYAEIFDLLEGVDQAISPRMMCAKAITRLVRAGSPRAIASIGNGQAEVLEVEVGLKEPTKLRKLGLPRGVVLGAIVRGETVTIPGGDTVVRKGDTAVMFATRESLEEAERALGVL